MRGYLQKHSCVSEKSHPNLDDDFPLLHRWRLTSGFLSYFIQSITSWDLSGADEGSAWKLRWQSIPSDGGTSADPRLWVSCGCHCCSKAVMTIMLRGWGTVNRIWLLRRAFMLHIRKRKAEESSQDYAKYILQCFSFSSLVWITKATWRNSP